jgi:signal transduction histidine kinase
MAEAAARGLGASRARVQIYVPGAADRTVAWPPDALDAAFDRTTPVLHHGALVGEIAISKPLGESLTDTERRLLTDLAAQAGAALNGVRLGVELQARLQQISEQAGELRASRERIVSAQNAERRRLERDLHDGAQQHLVAMSVNLRMVREFIEADLPAARDLLTEVQAQASDALATLRDLARGIYPPALSDRGIAAALEAYLAKSHHGSALEVHPPDSVARYAPEVEAAVYFCVLEALQNCAKHTPAADVRVELHSESDRLRFAVADSGHGFDPTSVASGTGLQGMRDRLAAVGGQLEVRSAPGEGTAVAGVIAVQRGLSNGRIGVDQRHPAP